MCQKELSAFLTEMIANSNEASAALTIKTDSTKRTYAQQGFKYEED